MAAHQGLERKSITNPNVLYSFPSRFSLKSDVLHLKQESKEITECSCQLLIETVSVFLQKSTRVVVPMMNMRIIFDIANMSILLVGIVASRVILIRSYMHHPSLTSNLPVFLTCNTYVILLLNCLVMFELYASTLYGDLHPLVDLENPWCFARYYLQCICLSALLYSYNVQAIFRLVRVIFYQRKNLQPFCLFGFALVSWHPTDSSQKRGKKRIRSFKKKRIIEKKRKTVVRFFSVEKC
jgi:hypothetical protein